MRYQRSYHSLVFSHWYLHDNVPIIINSLYINKALKKWNKLDESMARRQLKSSPSLSNRSLHLAFQGQGLCQTQCSHLWPRIQSICLRFASWQSNNFWLRYSKFHIWPWKVKVKVMAEVKSDTHICGLDQSICLLFVSWQSDHFWLRVRYGKLHIWPWKFKEKVTLKINQNLIR